MYNSTIVNQRISTKQNKKPFTQKQMLAECELNVNLLNKMTDNKGIGCFALARIADKLETSTDYLLGRTDNPEMTLSINNNVSAPQTNVHILTNENTPVTKDERELLDMINDLSLVQRSQLVLIIEKMKEGKKIEI